MFTQDKQILIADDPDPISTSFFFTHRLLTPCVCVWLLIEMDGHGPLVAGRREPSRIYKDCLAATRQLDEKGHWSVLALCVSMST